MQSFVNLLHPARARACLSYDLPNFNQRPIHDQLGQLDSLVNPALSNQLSRQAAAVPNELHAEHKAKALQSLCSSGKDCEVV